MILYLAIAAGPVVSGTPAILGQVHILRVVQLPVFTAHNKYHTINSSLFILIRYKKVLQCTIEMKSVLWDPNSDLFLLLSDSNN
jgi:hypothetical protein